MGDPRFHGSVVFLCAHSGEGAMGLIVNKPMPDVTFAQLLEQLEITRGPPRPRKCRSATAAPFELRRGFVLHSARVSR